jgi:lysophospholipase L1-like esterase
MSVRLQNIITKHFGRGPHTRPCLFVLLLATILFAIGASSRAADTTSNPILKQGVRLAMAGDSITEQMLYTRFVEDYLLMCVPELQTEVCQMGWSGEVAQGFLKRMDADIDWFKPNMVTLYYGMNDSNRNVYVPPMKKIAGKLKAQGIPAVIVSPGAVDTYYGVKGNDKQFWVGFNKEQGLMGEAAQKIAAENGLGFVDLHNPLLDVMAKAKAKYRPNYDVCGADGVHPRANGHLIIAWTLLKGLGMSGDLATISVSMRGGSTVTSGHKILADANGTIEIESFRYPFCFVDPGKQLSLDQPKFAGSTVGILPVLPFNQDLNRFRLVVTGLEWNKAKVTWGTASKVFSKQDLEQGINLAAEFLDNPFKEAFAKVDAAVLEKQKSERILIKNVIGGLPMSKPKPTTTSTTPPVEVPKPTKEEAIEQRTRLLNAAREAVQPVRHRITVTKAE